MLRKLIKDFEGEIISMKKHIFAIVMPLALIHHIALSEESIQGAQETTQSTPKLSAQDTLFTALQKQIPSQVNPTYILENLDNKWQQIHALSQLLNTQERYIALYKKYLQQQKNLNDLSHLYNRPLYDTMKQFLKAADSPAMTLGNLVINPLGFMEEDITLYSSPEGKAAILQEIESKKKNLMEAYRKTINNADDAGRNNNLSILLKQYEKEFIRYIASIQKNIEHDVAQLIEQLSQYLSDLNQ